MRSRRAEPNKVFRNDSSRKQDSDNSLRNVCYYLYFELLVLEPNVVIVINSNPRSQTKIVTKHRNYPCDCIILNGKPIYEMGMHYEFTDDI